MDDQLVIESLHHIVVSNNEFLDKVQEEIESDLARLNKNVIIVRNLRLAAAEMEVETAALYHARLCYEVENLKNVAVKSKK